MPNAIALPDELAELTSQLDRQGLGAAIDVSDLARALYSSDASLYRVVPRAVARPRSVDEAGTIMDAARAVGLPVTARGAGTSCAGNAVGPGLILDTSRHLNRILDIDAEARTARVEPGVVQAALQSAAAPPGLRFGPDPSTHTRCTIGGMIGNNACGPRALGYGKTADNIVALDVIAGSGERLTLGGDTGRCRLVHIDARPASVVASNLATDPHRVRPVRPTGLGLQPGAPAAGERIRCRPVPGRHRGHPRGDRRRDGPAGRRSAVQDHDRARLPDHGRGC